MLLTLAKLKVRAQLQNKSTSRINQMKYSGTTKLNMRYQIHLYEELSTQISVGRAKVVRRRLRRRRLAAAVPERDVERTLLAQGEMGDMFGQVLIKLGLVSELDFARAEREAGKSILDAAISAARLRFRPILMTSIAS